MSSQRQIVLGLFFVVALSILAFYTLFLTDFSLFKEQYDMPVHFSDAHGLRQGDPVMVTGVRLGRVHDVVYDQSAPEERRITATLRFTRPVTIHDGYSIEIEDSTFLGGKQVSIWPGDTTQSAIGAQTMLAGTVAEGPLAALSGVGDVFMRNEQNIDEFLTNLAEVSAALRGTDGTLGKLLNDPEMATETAEAFTAIRSTFENTTKLTDQIAEGEGSIGKLFSSDDLYKATQSFLENLDAVAVELSTYDEETSGPLARMIHDTEMGDELDKFVENISGMSSEVVDGKGTLHRLIYEDKIANNVEAFTTALNDPDSTIGALLGSREFYDKWMDITGSVANVAQAIEGAEGTVGKLVMEAELYDDILISVRLLNRSLEDYREAAPIATFTSVLFQAF